MKRTIIYVVGILALVACSHGSKPTSAKSDYKQQLWQKVSAEIDQDMQAIREPAAENNLVTQLKIDINDLRKKNKSFELYVFPKISTITEKNNEDEGELYLSKPLKMTVVPKYVSNCAYLFQGGNKQLNPVSYFPAEYKNDKKRICAILEITSEKMKDLSAALRRDGDEIRKRIYFDDQYRIFGVETDYYSGKAGRVEKKTVGVRYDGSTHSTTGLGLIPTELPSLANMNTAISVAVTDVFVDNVEAAKDASYGYSSDKTIVDIISINQIKRLNKKYTIPNCSLKKLVYKDFYGRYVRSFWCEGSAWPQAVDAPSFLAVTQELK